jgi:hypothetical protein
MPSVVSRLVIVFGILGLATAGHAAAKKKGDRKPAEAAGKIVPPPSDLTTLDSAPDTSVPSTPTPSGNDDPALYNLNQEIPLYRKQTSHESQRFSGDDPFLGTQKSSLRVGLSLTHFNYQELGLPFLNEENGLLPMLHLRYDSAPVDGRWTFGFRSEVNFFRTSYTGTTINNLAVIGQNHSAFMALGELWVRAKLFDAGEGGRASAYAGLGYRHWSRMAAGDGIDTFDLSYQWIYLPVGVRFDYQSLNDWGIGIDISVRQAFLGRVAYGFAEVDPTLLNTEGLLGSSALNFRVAVPVSFKKLIGFPVTFEPYFEQFGFGPGAPAPIVSSLNGSFKGFVQQPKSRTSQWGLMVTADFQF